MPGLTKIVLRKRNKIIWEQSALFKVALRLEIDNAPWAAVPVPRKRLEKVPVLAQISRSS